MRAGPLRHRITIQEREFTDDPTKLQKQKQWVDVATVWGSIEPLNGHEETRADQEVALVTHRVRIRHRDDVKAEMQLSARGRIFGIEVVKNVNERDRELELLCVEKA